jgi:serine/threonine-protein kinase
VTAPPVALAEALRDRYLLERELGAGGMATVYLAQDLRHHRRVALKVLRPELAAVIGAKRFLHEIETTANLQHPHILPLHDSGEVAGTAFYVMPHVEGESLRERLSRDKQLPIETAVRIATEVASALDYAHRKGVIHRDIKPENILLHEGQALVADFGIALAATAAGGSRMTETGMSLGTPHYMSPEQAMGEREITARSDVYALGCVLYEMLTGDPPFTGSTAQAIVARVVTEAPRPLLSQRHTIPPHVEAAVLTALEKLPADRFASAGELAQALASPGVRTAVTAARPALPRSRERIAWGTAAGLAVLLLGGTAYHLAAPKPVGRPLLSSLLPPRGCAFDPVVTTNLVQLSPDGRALAFIASCDSDRGLWVRSLETGESRKLPGTSAAAYPFWSPDGRSLGFFADERLRRIDLESGAIRDLASAPDGRGGAWNQSGIIVYAPDIFGALYQVSAGGGEPQPVTVLPEGARDVSHRLPYFLPDGRHFLFAQGAGAGVNGEVRAGELGSPQTRKVLEHASNVAFAEGYLLYAREGVLLAQPFDPGAIELSGNAVALAPAIESWAFRFLGNYSVATNGRLVYREADIPESRMEWFDPATGSRTPILDRGPYRSIRLSPDARRVLVARTEGRGPLASVWLYEPAQATWSRLSSEPKPEYQFAWSRDGREAILQPVSDSILQVLSLDAGTVRTLSHPTGELPILDWAPDGSYSVGTRQVKATGWDLIKWTGDSSPPVTLYATPADELSPRISPDGRALAYVSNQTGRAELYLARLPGMTGHVQVSGAGSGGRSVAGVLAWSRNGKTLFFLDGAGALYSVPVSTSPELRIGKPMPVAGAPNDIRDVEAGPNGKLLLLDTDHSAESPLTLVENWASMVRRR